MPANLTPEYKAAEEEYRRARAPQERLTALEKMLSTIPKHKGTEKMQADLKRRIARLKESLQKKSGKRGFAVTVDKEGAAQVALVGPPNSGKSTLLECTTNARAEVGDHPHSTRSPVPGMLEFENLQFQLVDLPPLAEQYLEPWVTDIIRVADSALLVLDAAGDCRQQVETVESILKGRKISLCPPEQFPGAVGPVRELPSVVVANKMDLDGAAAGLAWLREYFQPRGLPVLPLSALDDDFSALGQHIFACNAIVRVYSKSPGKEADTSKPFVMHRGDTLLDFARVVHKDFAEKLRYARVWGKGKFAGQRIQRDQLLADGDIIELHI